MKSAGDIGVPFSAFLPMFRKLGRLLGTALFLGCIVGSCVVWSLITRNLYSDKSSTHTGLHTGEFVNIRAEVGLLATTEENETELLTILKEKDHSEKLESMINAGKVLMVPKGTQVFVISQSKKGYVRIQVNDDGFAGEVGYIAVQDLT